MTKTAISGFLCASLLAVASAHTHAAMLESPPRGRTVSGLGFISGWKCNASDITLRINGGEPIPVLYGNDRLDTHVSRGGPCDHQDTGFILQVNWAELGDGAHAIELFDEDSSFAHREFYVTTFGEPFVENAAGSCEIPDFPEQGETARFTWNEATQHLELSKFVARMPDDFVPPTLDELVGTNWSFRSDLTPSQNTALIITSAAGDTAYGRTLRRASLIVVLNSETYSPQWLARGYTHTAYWESSTYWVLYVFKFTGPETTEGFAWDGEGAGPGSTRGGPGVPATATRY